VNHNQALEGRKELEEQLLTHNKKLNKLRPPQKMKKTITKDSFLIFRDKLNSGEKFSTMDLNVTITINTWTDSVMKFWIEFI